MKLNTFKSIVLMLFVICVTSCKQNIETNPTSNVGKSLYEMLMSKNMTPDGNITLIASSMSSHDLPAQLDIEAWFKDKKGKIVGAEQVQVNTFEIGTQANFRYSRHFSTSNDLREKEFANITSNLFGSTVKFKVNSAAFGNVEANMYSPLVVKMDLSSLQNNIVLKKTGITIKWNPDKGRALLRDGYEPQMGAVAMYQAGIYSNSSQAGMPTQNITTSHFTNDSNGQITFTPEDLANFPTGGYIVIFLGRAEQTIVTTSTGQSLAVTSLASCASQELLMQ